MKTVLFQGDSITEWRRNIQNPDDLGSGYTAIAAQALSGRGYRFVNRGVGGDRIAHIRARWQKDCLDIKPEVLVFYAGVNDVLVQLYENFMTKHDEFLRDFTFVLEEFKKAVPDAKIIMIEPFMLNTADEIRSISAHLAPIKQMVRTLAGKYADDFVPLAEIYDRTIASGFSAASLAEDGVHPTAFGYYLLADAVIGSLKKFI